ncbi:MAG: sigma-70 family RNA polymerase sigma factor [Labilithrix sp.]|nr:sigma-70 family RNA polymerase sigma factor [Labilithrix sp.]MCW5831179.1 sigma-70 family RNA polymerase sigma factor [Labilithrix sp.]
MVPWAHELALGLQLALVERTTMPTDAVTAPAERSPRTLVAHDQRSLELGLVELIPELRGRACRLAGDPTTADDVVQDTIERALKFAKQYERGTNLRAWVYQILFSVFITRYRRARRDKNALRALASDPCAWTTPERFASPDAAVSLTHKTQVTLDALPETFRSVLKLVDLDELTYREAANELGVPVGTVMSRLHRGRKLLASQLHEAA